MVEHINIVFISISQQDLIESYSIYLALPLSVVNCGMRDMTLEMLKGTCCVNLVVK